LEKVRQEWRLICAGHNLLELFAALKGSRRRQGAPDWLFAVEKGQGLVSGLAYNPYS